MDIIGRKLMLDTIGTLYKGLKQLIIFSVDNIIQDQVMLKECFSKLIVLLSTNITFKTFFQIYYKFQKTSMLPSLFCFCLNLPLPLKFPFLA